MANFFLGVGQSNSLGTSQPRIIKFDTAGSFIWDRPFLPSLISTGGSYFDKISRCRVNNNEFFFSTLGIWLGNNVNLISKIDSSGDTIWVGKFFHFNTSSIKDHLSMFDGSVLVGGMKEYGGTGFDPFLSRLDSNGNIMWEKVQFIPGDQELLSSIELFDGGFLFSGYSDSSHYLIKVDLNGDIVWDTVFASGFGGAVQKNKLQLGPDSTFYLIGWSNINNNSFPGELIKFKNRKVEWRIVRDEGAEHILMNSDFKLISEKTDLSVPNQGIEILNDTFSEGFVMWPFTSQWEAFRDIQFFGNGKLMAAGEHRVSIGNSNYWVSAVSGVGNEWVPDPCEISPPKAGFSWSYTNPTLTLVDTSYSGLQYLDTIYQRSWMVNTTGVDSGETYYALWDTLNQPNLDVQLVVGNWYGCTDTLNATLTFHPNGIEQLIHYKWEPILFPNPAKDYLNIQISGKNLPHEIIRVRIFDLHGKLVGRYEFSQLKRKIPINGLASGIYLASIDYLGEKRYLRFVKR